MSDSSELVERLRTMDRYIQAQHKAAGQGTCGHGADRIEADAALITELRAQLARLRGMPAEESSQ